MRIQDLCKGGGPKRDFADIVQQSCGSGKNLGLKIGGSGGRAPLDPHLQGRGVLTHLHPKILALSWGGDGGDRNWELGCTILAPLVGIASSE